MSIDRLVVWGCGELGSRVARLWMDQGGAVVGITQTDERHVVLEKLGIFPVTAEAGFALRDEDWLLISTPGSTNQLQALEYLIRDLPPYRSVLASTVGVYGNQKGQLDENSPIGATPRALNAAQAEATFATWARDRGVTLRFGGLYQPGRGPFAAFARKRKIPDGDPARPLTLIHYDDAAQTAFQALRHPDPARCYLALCNPSPTRQMFYAMAQDALGIASTQDTSEATQPNRQFDTTRLHRDLLPSPQYPDWRAVLTSE